MWHDKSLETCDWSEKRTSYVLVYDLLNIVSCIAVVVLHVNGGFFGGGESLWWKFSVFVDCLFYWAVPIFFMLTGATLLDYRNRYDTISFLEKRLKKTVIPFVFWSIISIPLSIYGFSDVHLEKEMISTWQGLINVILNHKGASIYWFFSPLFAMYLSIPVLSTIPLERRKNIYGFMIMYSFVSYSMLPTLCSVLGITFNNGLQNPLNGGGYVIYLLLGYWITNYQIKKQSRICIYLLAVVCTCFRILYTISKSIQSGYIDYTYSGYINFPAVIMAIAVFIWFYYQDWSFFKKPRLVRIIQEISSASFGVYLIHIYILRFIVVKCNIYMQSFKWSVLGVPIVYILSLFLVLLGKKIPIIRKLIP